MAQQSANPQSAPAAKTAPAAETPAPAGDAALPTQKDKLSYALGMNIGRGLHKDSVDVNPTILMRGLKDAMAGGTTLMTDEQAQATIMELQGQLRAKLEAQRKASEATNKKDGEAFLAANKTKPGVITLPSGLQYKILKEGTGTKPTPTDSVECNYKGTLINGTEFDSSYKRGQPATFPVTGVIKGWTEALQLMPVGSKWQLVLPPDLAYGARGAGDAIGPDETLVFEVELLSIAKKDQGAAPSSK
ncbi:MAG: FKBP-type peptidyl-prolyl cis-trans isomerase [Candidatus Korobacteraceae bacterium]|jgi:FKBP-type peptidyl-prolyl cis-trans isomerase